MKLIRNKINLPPMGQIPGTVWNPVSDLIYKPVFLMVNNQITFATYSQVRNKRML